MKAENGKKALLLFGAFFSFYPLSLPYRRCELTLCNNPAHSEKARKLEPP